MTEVYILCDYHKHVLDSACTITNLFQFNKLLPVLLLPTIAFLIYNNSGAFGSKVKNRT